MPTNRIRVVDLGPRDGSLYVHGYQSSLRISRSRLVAQSEDERSEIPLERLGRVFILGKCSMSSGSLEALLTAGIPIFHLTSHGALKGISSAQPNIRPELRAAQWDISGNHHRAIALARSLVSNKIMNQRVLLMRYLRRWEIQGIASQIAQLRDSRRSLSTATSVEELMGIEGSAARVYFSALREVIEPRWGFQGRNRRPAQDPINSLLSFGYSLLLGEMSTALTAAGFDIGLGILHRSRDNRPSLALDLMEEFRAVIVDTLVLTMVNTNRISLDEFLISTSSRDPEVRLTAAGRRQLFQEYERRMSTVALHRPSGRRVAYREALFLQSRQLADVFLKGSELILPAGWS